MSVFVVFMLSGCNPILSIQKGISDAAGAAGKAVDDAKVSTAGAIGVTTQQDKYASMKGDYDKMNGVQKAADKAISTVSGILSNLPLGLGDAAKKVHDSTKISQLNVQQQKAEKEKAANDVAAKAAENTNKVIKTITGNPMLIIIIIAIIVLLIVLLLLLRRKKNSNTPMIVTTNTQPIGGGMRF